MSFSANPVFSAESSTLHKYHSYGITGGTGSIGSQLIRKLLTNEGTKKITVLTRELKKSTCNRLVIGDRRISPIIGDLSLLIVDQLEAFVKESEVIIHLGGWNGLQEIPQSEALAINALSTTLLTLLARKHNKRLIFSSSIYVYQLGNIKEGKVAEGDLLVNNQIHQWLIKTNNEFVSYSLKYLDRQNSLDPISFIEDLLSKEPLPNGTNSGSQLYALTNLLAEQSVLNYENGIILRFSNVYGPGDETDRVVPKMLSQMSRSSQPAYFIPGRQYSLIYVDDVIRALLNATTIDIKPKQNQIINVAHLDLISHNILFEKIREITNPSISIAPYTTETIKKLGIPNPTPISFDVSLMNSELGLSSDSLTKLENGLARTKKWLLELDSSCRWTFNVLKKS